MRVDQSRILNPGLLRHQTTWQRKAVTGQDSYGEDVFAWIEVVTLRAQVRQMQGREIDSARQSWPDARYSIMQPYRAGLDTAMRISWYIDGEVRALDVLDIADTPGVGRYQTVIAKDHRE